MIASRIANYRSAIMLALLLATHLGRAQSTPPIQGGFSYPGSLSAPDQNASSPGLQNSPGSSKDAAAQSPDGSGFNPDGAANISASLSTSQIIAVLQAQPDALVELKQYVSDAAAKQGAPVQPDAITDDMLFSRIASSPALRSNITVFLHARGYITDADLEDSISARGEQDPLYDPRLQGQSGLTTNPSSFGNSSAILTQSNGWPENTRSLRDNGIPMASGRGDRSSPTAKSDRSSTAEPRVLHQPAPYNLRSLHDLYAQLPEQSEPLKRFGSETFLQRSMAAGALINQLTPNSRETPLDVPAGPSYVVGPGDSLQIDMWGGISQSMTRVIDREGRIALPESGNIQIAGLTLERVQGVLTDTLRQQYRSIQVAVTVQHLRSIRVYVVGDVQRPGAYDISSLSTPLNALYAAGGPTATGSLRMLQHYRGKQMVGEIDLYDFLLHGVQVEDRLQAGDTILVPPVGAQIAVYGAVKRPAIYELRSNVSLADILTDAGGATVAAELGQIEIDRIDAHQQRETVSLPIPGISDPEHTRAAIASFPMQDGDRVRVTAILPYSQRVIYMQGHVVRPGRLAYHDGMRITDVLQSYRDLLPEPADRAEIIRLVAPDLHVETIDFNLPDALIGNGNVILQPFDTVRIYGRYESDAPMVVIAGEVLRPGTYSLSSGMTAAGLVRMAGGFKRDALLDKADLTSYRIVDGTRVVSERSSIPIGDAVTHEDKRSDALLKPGDVLTVHQITGWNDIGASITLEGEVEHPGSYGIQQGEHLSSILRRAGGLRGTAYAAGAVLLRDEVRALEEKSREELIKQLETSASAARMRPSLGSGDQSATLQLIAQQQEQVLARLKSQPAIGRLVIHVSSDIASWENTPADIEVRAGDVLRVPKRPGFILVSGQVYNTSAITFSADKTAGWYLKRAGGATEIANTRDIFIIRANGSVVGRGSGSFLNHDVLATKLDPGDVVVVPQKILGASVFWRNLLTVAQISSSIAITAAVAGLL